MAAPYLIVNADDFGQSHSVNRGIMVAHERGIVTSASLMVRWPAAAEAVAYSRARPALSLGLHVDFGEWGCRDGHWRRVYEVLPDNDPTAVAVAAEVARQLATFRCLVGKDPTHLDSHQHAHLGEPLRSVLTDVARELAVPLRHCTAAVHYCGNFYGQTATGDPYPEAISVDGLINILKTLPPGCTELCCHPGLGHHDLDTMYRNERAQEVQVLCDPRVRAAIVALGIHLGSFLNCPGRPMETLPAVHSAPLSI